MDKRVQKTRKNLQNALLELLREKSLEAIEIQEITEQANTARVTFYRHYGTKEELLLDTMEHIYLDFREHIPFPSRPEDVLGPEQPPPILALFEFLGEDRELYKKLFTGSVSVLIQQRLRHYIVEQLIKAFSSSPQYGNLPLFLIANHIASVNIGNIIWWLADDLPYSPEYMAKITHRLSLVGVMGFVKESNEFPIPLENK